MKTASMATVIACATLALVLPCRAADEAEPFANNACVQCHRDLAGRSSEIVHLEWAQSVHYDAGVGCEGCHGGNASVRRDQFESAEAMKRASHLERNPELLLMHESDREFVSGPRGRSVSYFCGQCHAEIKEKHLGSPHGDFGDPTCLYCHGGGSHKITNATPEIIDTRTLSEGGRCSRCHAAGTMGAVSRIKEILIDTEARMMTSGEKYAHLEGWGYRNLELEELHHHAAEVNSRLRRIFHSFNMAEINSFAGEINDIADRTDETYELVVSLRATQRRQTIVGLCAVALLMTLAGVLVYYKHEFLE